MAMNRLAPPYSSGEIRAIMIVVEKKTPAVWIMRDEKKKEPIK